jgi:hypothetical protein
MIQQEQVDEIIAFCEAKGVTYYDVQVELVDHIADSIEELQKSNPALSFSDALHLAGKQFGNQEFAAIVKSKKRLIEKRMSRLIEREFLSFFTFPRIMITILLLGVAITGPYLMNKNIIWTIIIAVIPVGRIYYLHYGPNIEIRAIKEACRIPMLSLTIQSRYERCLGLVHKLSHLYIFIYFFFRLNQSDIVKIRTPLTTQQLVPMQIVFATIVILCLLYLSTLYVRRRVYNKIFDQYTKAFISE